MDVGLFILIYDLFFLKETFGHDCKNGWIHNSGWCYKLEQNKVLNRDDASTACQNEPRGAELILPRSDNDTDIIRKVLNMYGINCQSACLVINIRYKGPTTYEWIDQDNNVMTYLPWVDNKRAFDPQDLLCASFEGSGKWELLNCNDQLPYMCIQKDHCYSKNCGIFDCKDGQCNYCSPNHCENGKCVQVPNPTFSNDYNFTCECSDRYEGHTCTLKDDPCAKPKCKNNGVCKVKEKPGKNDWFCVCQGELKKGQAKDCSEGKDEETIRYEYEQKIILAAAVAVPFGLLGVAWLVCCVCECVTIGELPDREVASVSSTTSSSPDADAEAAELPDQDGGENERNAAGESKGWKMTVRGLLRCFAPKPSTPKSDNISSKVIDQISADNDRNTMESSSKKGSAQSDSNSDKNSMDYQVPLAIAEKSKLKTISLFNLTNILPQRNDPQNNGRNEKDGGLKTGNSSETSGTNTTLTERDRKALEVKESSM